LWKTSVLLHKNSKVVASELPANSSLHERVLATDFFDCYSVRSNLPPRRAAEIIAEFPKWAQFLLQIRRLVTTPFGLSNDGPEASDKLGAFPVELETESEVIARFNDKHLNFRVCVFAQDGRISLSTWAHPHNIGGKLYLKAILQFHILIARNALARVAMTQPLAV
jgi:hypothetical protein